MPRCSWENRTELWDVALCDQLFIPAPLEACEGSAGSRSKEASLRQRDPGASHPTQYSTQSVAALFVHRRRELQGSSGVPQCFPESEMCSDLTPPWGLLEIVMLLHALHLRSGFCRPNSYLRAFLEQTRQNGTWPCVCVLACCILILWFKWFKNFTKGQESNRTPLLAFVSLEYYCRCLGRCLGCRAQ